MVDIGRERGVSSIGNDSIYRDHITVFEMRNEKLLNIRPAGVAIVAA